MEKKYIVTVNSSEEEGFEIGVSHVSDEINIAIKLNQSVPGKKTDMKVSITPCDAKDVDLPEGIISGTATRAFFKKFGNQKNGCYGATPDSKGKWFVPAATFYGFTNLKEVFMNLHDITSLNLGNLNTGNVIDMEGMFKDCPSLMSLDVSHFNTRNVTNMAYMFTGCSKLTFLDVSSWDVSNVSHMDFMFYNCENLTSLDLSGWNTGCVKDMTAMLCACSKLLSLDLSGWNVEEVLSMDSMFSYCEKLTYLNLNGWNIKNVTNMIGMFEGCYSLRTITLVGCDGETIRKIKERLEKDGVKDITIVTE